MTNRIKDIRNRHNERMERAVKFSEKLSVYIRYLAVTGLGIIWLLVQSGEHSLNDLLHNHWIQAMIVLCLLVLLLGLCHLTMNVIVNLLYANCKLKKPLSYSMSPRKTEYVATKFPKWVIKTEWIIWFGKIICLLSALVIFILCLVLIMIYSQK